MKYIKFRTAQQLLAVTAIAIATLAVGLIFQKTKYPADVDLVEARLIDIAKDKNFKLDEARSAGYPDRELAEHLAKSNNAEGRQFREIFITALGACYVVLVLLIILKHETTKLRTIGLDNTNETITQTSSPEAELNTIEVGKFTPKESQQVAAQTAVRKHRYTYKIFAALVVAWIVGCISSRTDPTKIYMIFSEPLGILMIASEGFGSLLISFAIVGLPILAYGKIRKTDVSFYGYLAWATALSSAMLAKA